MIRTCLAIAVAITAAGCGHPDQTYTAAMKIICDSPNRVSPGPDRVARGLQVVKAIVENPRARAVMGSMAATEGGSKSEALRKAARDAGLDQCALADEWEKP